MIKSDNNQKKRSRKSIANTRHSHCPSAGESPTYSTWRGMLCRCKYPSNASYSRYGGRGIKVCARWEKFVNFLEDMGERPEGMTLDRLNTDGDYEPVNCVWSTRNQQQRNKSNTVMLEFNGRTQSIADWADELGFCRRRLHNRLQLGWTIERALTTPVKHRRCKGKK